MNSNFCLKFNSAQLETEYLLQRRKEMLFICLLAFIVRAIFVIAYIIIWAVSGQPFITKDWLATPLCLGFQLLLLLMGLKFPIFYSKYNAPLFMVSFYFQIFSFNNADGQIITQQNLYFFIYNMIAMVSNTQWIITSISILITLSGMVTFMLYFQHIVMITAILLFISSATIIYVTYILEKETKNLFLQLCTVRNINKDFQNIISILPEAIILYDKEKQDILMVNQEFHRIFGCQESKNSEDMMKFIKQKTLKKQQTPKSDKKEAVSIFSNDTNEKTEETGNQLTLQSAMQNIVLDQYYEVINQSCEQELQDKHTIITFKESEIVFQEKKTRLIMAHDISQVVQYEKMKLENHYYEMLTATVSHDMRTPLNAIIGLLKSISKFVTDSQGKRMYDIILHSSKILLYLVNDHLDMFQLKNGKFKKNETIVEIETSIQELIEMFKVCADEKRIDLSYEVDPNVPTYVVIDEQRVLQVLINLISNAFKFTTRGFIKVFVSFDSNNEMLQFNVRDSGIGIKKEDRSKLFTLFGKIEQTASINTSGIGLGLSICQKIVQTFNGDIKIDQDYDMGASFTFNIKCPSPQDLHSKFENSTINLCNATFNETLGGDKSPLIRVPNSNAREFLNDRERIHFIGIQDRSSTMRGQQRNQSEDYTVISVNHIDPNFVNYTTNYQPKLFQAKHNHCQIQRLKSNVCPCKARPTILIVDDNIFNIITLETILEMQFNINADKAMNGEEAVERVLDRLQLNRDAPCICDSKNYCYQLIFMDCNMPVMDGFTATQEIKRILESEMNMQVSIIALTAYTTDNFKAKCINSGMDGFLSKPINVQQLSQLIDQIE